MHFPQNSTKKPNFFFSRFAISWAKFGKLVTCELIFWSKVTQSQPSCFGSHIGFSISLKSGLKIILVQINSHLGSYLGYTWDICWDIGTYIDWYNVLKNILVIFFHPVTPYWTYTFVNKTFLP